MHRILAALLWTVALHAQHFEVASIKRSPDCSGRHPLGARTPGRINIQCETIEGLIQGAYVAFANGVTLNPAMVEIAGLPGWVKSEYYDVVAKAEDQAPVAKMWGPMMQALLEERLQLKVRHDTKEVPVYFMIIAKGGFKPEPTKDGSCITMDWDRPLPTPRPRLCGAQRTEFKGPVTSMTAVGNTMEDLATWLTRFAQRLTIDKTGLTGRYDFHLEFTPNQPTTAATPGEPQGPSLFDVLAKLGVKLESGKGPAPILVIEHVERPTEN